MVKTEKEAWQNMYKMGNLDKQFLWTIRILMSELVLMLRPRHKVYHRFGYLDNCEVYFIEKNLKMIVNI